MFRDRQDAAEQLISALKQYQHEDAVVLAVPRGGVPIGKIVAEALELPLDISLTKKIGHPKNKEYAIGAVSLESEFISEAGSMVPRDYVDEEVDKIRDKLETRYHQYMGEKEPYDLTSKTALIVDDGVATGNTLLATAQLARKKGAAKIIIAVPVGSPSAIGKLRKVADDVICLDMPPDFRAVGQFYEHFDQVSDEEVIAMLNKTNRIWNRQ